MAVYSPRILVSRRQPSPAARSCVSAVAARAARSRQSRRHDGPHGAAAVADPVRVRDELSHHLPGVHDRAGELAGVPGRRVPEDPARTVARAVRVLAEDLRRVVRARRRVGHRHELSVRHQLGRAVDARRQHSRSPARVRSADGVLPGSDVPRRDAVRLAARVAAAAFLRDLHGGARHADLHVLDHFGEQLDAHAHRLSHRRRRVPSGELVADRLQPVVPAASRAHDARRIHHDVFRDRRHQRGVPAAPAPSRSGAADAQAVDLLRGNRSAAADRGRRSARPEGARSPADEARRDGRTLGNDARRAAGPVRMAG